MRNFKKDFKELTSVASFGYVRKASSNKLIIRFTKSESISLG